MADKRYILAIDTTEENTGIGLAGERLTKIKTWVSQRNQSQELLPNIDKLLKTNRVKPEELKWVAVNLGPGSFTGLRVGISVANAFGYGLQIPVIGKAHLIGKTAERIKHLLKLTTKIKKFRQVLPVYGAPPNITRPPARPDLRFRPPVQRTSLRGSLRCSSASGAERSPSRGGAKVRRRTLPSGTGVPLRRSPVRRRPSRAGGRQR